MKNFALVGAAGYIAPRHLKAIHDTGNNLVAAVDPHDCVGRLDSFFPEARFFTEIERFDRFLEKRRRGPEEGRIEYVSVCSPNYLHDAHIRMALRTRAHAICEKPLVLSPWNLDALEEMQEEYGRKVYTVLQLRMLEPLIELRKKLHAQNSGERQDVVLTYITRRGPWYQVSWKGIEDKSGGLAMNIGIHFFDLLQWLFGEPDRWSLHLQSPTKMAGSVELDRARVRWFLSTDSDDLPAEVRAQGKTAFRSLTLDGQELEFSEGFTELHTRTYEQILSGKGYGIHEARPAIELVHSIRHSDIVSAGRDAHPMLETVQAFNVRQPRRAA